MQITALKYFQENEDSAFSECYVWSTSLLYMVKCYLSSFCISCSTASCYVQYINPICSVILLNPEFVVSYFKFISNYFFLLYPMFLFWLRCSTISPMLEILTELDIFWGHYIIISFVFYCMILVVIVRYALNFQRSISSVRLGLFIRASSTRAKIVNGNECMAIHSYGHVLGDSYHLCSVSDVQAMKVSCLYVSVCFLLSGIMYDQLGSCY